MPFRVRSNPADELIRITTVSHPRSLYDIEKVNLLLATHKKEQIVVQIKSDSIATKNKEASLATQVLELSLRGAQGMLNSITAIYARVFQVIAVSLMVCALYTNADTKE
jgi:hypothetical protein